MLTGGADIHGLERARLSAHRPAPVRALTAGTAVWMGGMIKAVAVYDRQVWRDAGLAGAAMSHLGPFRELHDHSGPAGSPAALFGFAVAAQFDGAGPERIAGASMRPEDPHRGGLQPRVSPRSTAECSPGTSSAPSRCSSPSCNRTAATGTGRTSVPPS